MKNNAFPRACVVLVVDDSEDAREVLAEHLRSRGMFVHLADSAAAAREVLGSAAIDVIVTDVTLGGESGIQMMLELRRDAHLASIPAIVTSGRHDVEDVVDEHPDLFQAALGKPFDVDELVRAIDHLTTPAAA
jgi:two-component system OmpR family response regulator